MPQPSYLAAALLLGLPVGMIIARQSVRMPGGAVDPGRGRAAAFALACAGLGAWAALAWPGPKGALGAIMAWQLLLLATLDAEHFWLPRALTIPLIISGLALAAAGDGGRLVEHALGAVLGYLTLATLNAVYRRLRGRDGLGGGDAWLLAGGGAWVGWAGLPTILIWAAGAGLVHVAVLALRGRRVDGRQPVPFGVGLALGIWLTWLHGPLGGAFR